MIQWTCPKDRKAVDNMIYLEYVNTLLYNEEDVKRMTFCDIESAREFISEKKYETYLNGKLFYVIKCTEV